MGSRTGRGVRGETNFADKNSKPHCLDLPFPQIIRGENMDRHGLLNRHQRLWWRPVGMDGGGQQNH